MSESIWTTISGESFEQYVRSFRDIVEKLINGKLEYGAHYEITIDAVREKTSKVSIIRINGIATVFLYECVFDNFRRTAGALPDWAKAKWDGWLDMFKDEWRQCYDLIRCADPDFELIPPSPAPKSAPPTDPAL